MKLSIFFVTVFLFNLLLVHTTVGEDKKDLKCKEHIDAALKQYWDHEKDDLSLERGSVPDLTQEDDDDSKEESSKIKVTEETAETEEDEDDDNDVDDEDDGTAEEESKEEPAPKVEEKKAPVKEAVKEEPDTKEESLEEPNDTKSEEDVKEVKEKKLVKRDEKPGESEEDDTKEDDATREDDDDQTEEDESEEVRSRDHIEEILHLDEIGSVADKEEQTLVASIFKELKRIYESAIKPLELLYKYRSITNRLISDAEIFAKPLILFIGGKSSGKTTLINYLLGLQKTPWEFPTGQPVSQTHFTVIGYGPEYTKQTAMEFAADMQFSNLQQFGENFLEQRVQAYRMPLDILERMTIIDTASIVEQVKKEKSQETDIFQWFFDRSDVIYFTLDLKQLTITNQMKTILEQLKGRDIRFVLTKADTLNHGQLILSIGQLFWMLSPLIDADMPPRVYALTTAPLNEYDVFLDEQERLWLTDLSEQVLSVARIESRIASVRRHAVRVRNHAKLVDCYLNTYYKHKGLFMFGESAKKLANEIAQNPHAYNIFSSGISTESKYVNQLSAINSNINIENNFNMNNVNKKIANEAMQNISRFDLPDADVYKAFFSVHSLLDFQPLSSTCSFFKGCPLDRIDVSIAYTLPELVTTYKKKTKFTLN